MPRSSLVPMDFVADSQSQQVRATYQLQYLPPYSINNYYVGRPSDAVSFTTAEGEPGPIPYLEASVRSSYSFSLIWKAPEQEDRNMIIVGYDLAYQTVDGLELRSLHDRDEQIINPYALQAILSGLLPNVKYRVHIFARTWFGRGERTYIEALTTEKSAFGTPEFEIVNIQENSFNITWQASYFAGVQVVHYVEFKKEGAATWQLATDLVLNNYKEITSLEKAAARAIAANYGWFIGMLLSGLFFICIVVFIYWVHRKRKDVEQKPKSRPEFSFSGTGRLVALGTCPNVGAVPPEVGGLSTSEAWAGRGWSAEAWDCVVAENGSGSWTVTGSVAKGPVWTKTTSPTFQPAFKETSSDGRDSYGEYNDGPYRPDGLDVGGLHGLDNS